MVQMRSGEGPDRDVTSDVVAAQAVSEEDTDVGSRAIDRASELYTSMEHEHRSTRFDRMVKQAKSQ